MYNIKLYDKIPDISSVTHRLSSDGTPYIKVEDISE